MTKYKLGDLIDVTRGMSLPGDKYAESGNLIRLTLGNFNLQGNEFKPNTSKTDIYFTGSVKKEFIMKKGDIITPLTEQTYGLLGSTARIPESGKYIQSQDVALIKSKSDKLYEDFCYYLISSPSVRKQLGAAAQQTKIRHTSPDKIKDCEVIIPEDVNQQIKITNLLNTIENKIALNNKTNTELENMAKTIYDYWFTQFDFPDKNGHPYKTSGGQMVYNEILKREIPAGWEVRTIESISKRVKVGFVGPIDEYYCDNNSGYPIIRPAEMSEQGINYDELRHITKEFYDKNLKSQIHKGDILLSRCGKDGIPNIYESDKEAQVLNVVIIEPNREIISEYFTFDAMRSQFIQDQISNGTSGSVQGVINTKIIAAVILPFYETVAKKYVEEVSPIHQKISKCREESRKLTSLRDYLLPLLMNGQIEVK